MADSSSKNHLKRLKCPSSILLFQRLSLRSLKRIVLGCILCNILGFLLFLQPAYLRLKSLENEKSSWQQVLNTGMMNIRTKTKINIPTMDQLPDMIEKCRGTFIKEGVNVVALNVERFGEPQQTGKEASVDYSLVRLRLCGNWERIVISLKALEETQEGNIHVQEVALDSEGGEALLQIYFCTGEPK